MMFEISATTSFSASHQLRLYDGAIEPLHGHNWQVKVTVAAEKLDVIGVVMDFHQLERRLHRIIDGYHNHHLNDLPAFAQANPSAENVALRIAEALKLPARVTLLAVEVCETPENCAVVRFVDSRQAVK
jgi:6-pyruvoyltetrahydropterin/6-carboxytetrahydropterin synthase